MEEYGKLKILHPFYQMDVKNKKGRVIEESKDTFLSTCDAFVHHHAEFTCMNYQKKAYHTQCGCMTDLISGENNDNKMKQVCECLWTFFWPANTQVLVMKEWIRNSTTFVVKNNQRQSQRIKLSYVLPGVFLDASVSPTSMSHQTKNLIPYKVCLNAISLLFNYGYNRIAALKNSMNLPGLKSHGLKNKPSNRIIKKSQYYKDVLDGLHKFFAELKEEAETHATRVI